MSYEQNRLIYCKNMEKIWRIRKFLPDKFAMNMTIM